MEYKSDILICLKMAVTQIDFSPWVLISRGVFALIKIFL